MKFPSTDGGWLVLQGKRNNGDFGSNELRMERTEDVPSESTGLILPCTNPNINTITNSTNPNSISSSALPGPVWPTIDGTTRSLGGRFNTPTGSSSSDSYSFLGFGPSIASTFGLSCVTPVPFPKPTVRSRRALLQRRALENAICKRNRLYKVSLSLVVVLWGLV